MVIKRSALFCTVLPSNIVLGWFAFVAFNTSSACCEGSELNLYAHSEILERSCFKISADVLGVLNNVRY